MKIATKRAQKLADLALQRGAIQKRQELEFFIDQVLEWKPNYILEIGTHTGGTLSVWEQIAKDLAVGIDNSTEAAHARNLHLLNVLIADSHSPETFCRLEAIYGIQYDMVFIDGDHSYEGVKTDYITYGLFENCHVAFHDICAHPDRPEIEVSKLWQEIKGEHSQEFVYEPKTWGGIGVL